MQAFLADNPVLQNILDMASIIIPLAMLFAFCGISILAVSGEILSLRRRRSFYGRCAMQLSLLGQGLGWTLLVGGRIWLYFFESNIPGESALTIHEISWIVLGLSVIFSCIYFLLWKTLAQYPGIHIGVGVVSALQGMLAVLVVLACLRVAAVINLPHADEASMPTLAEVLTPVWGTDYATSLCYVPLLLLGMPAAFGCVWLLLRRKKDDYGRDHYNTVLPWCASWARNIWGILWLVLLVTSCLALYRQMAEGALMTEDAVTAGIRILLWLIPFLLWLIVARSATPLRHKLGLVISLVLSCLFMLPFFMGLSNWTPLP